MNAARRWTWGWAPSTERTGRVLILALCVFWAIAAIWAMVNGPRLSAEADQLMAAEAETESQGVCQRLGMPLGTETYATCSSELRGVRQHQEERLNRRSLGFI